MSVLATDNFNRADLGNLGANWTQTEGLNSILSNQVVWNTSSPTQETIPIYTAITWPADQYTTVTYVTGRSSLNIPGVVVRMASAAITGYVLDCQGADIGGTPPRLRKMVAGVSTTLQSGMGADWSAGDIVTLEVVGSNFVAKINGVQIGTTASDSAIASGSAGLFLYSDGALKMDNFEGGSTQTAYPFLTTLDGRRIA